jgi:hypothetical protein
MDKSTLTELFTDSNTCFLFGAGCSKCAGKPLMAELTTKVVAKLSKEGQAIVGTLNGSDGVSPPTVEDLTNQLLQLRSAILQRKNAQIDGWDLDKINNEIALIQKEVVNVIGPTWEASQNHKDFLLRLIQTSKATRDIFSLNYDTLLEASIEDLKLSYGDGFRGAENAYFDESTYLTHDKKNFNIYKLHGSVNWVREEDKTVRRKPLTVIAGMDQRHVIYPAEQKFVQTQYGVYEVLLKLFRERLKNKLANNRLIVMGYSFSDEHINIAIEDGILAPGSNLTVFAFVGAGISDVRKKQLQEMAERCDNRFNVFLSDKEYIGTGLNKADCEATMKLTDLSRFENIVKLLTGTI